MIDLLTVGNIGGDLAKTAEETARQFGVRWDLFLAQCASFLIVAGLVARFAFGPILKTLEDRRRKIEESLENAARIQAELAQTQAARRQTLEEAAGEASKMIEEARAAAARLFENETQKAVAAASLIIAKAREANEAELARMKAELRKEVGRLVVATTAKVAGKILTLDDQQRLAEAANKELAA